MSSLFDWPVSPRLRRRLSLIPGLQVNMSKRRERISIDGSD
jgi:hypothetical protein